MKKKDGSVERWLDDDELIEDYGNDYYEAYLDGYYSSSHYLVDITSHSVSVNDSVVSDFANAYISKSRVEDFVSQIEQWDEVEKMTDKQYNAMITDKDLPDRIRNALSKNDTYWEAYWQSISELAFRLVEEYSKNNLARRIKTMQFHETVYGKRFFEVQLPKLTAAINRLAEAIEHQNQQDENSSKENEK